MNIRGHRIKLEAGIDSELTGTNEPEEFVRIISVELIVDLPLVYNLGESALIMSVVKKLAQ